MNRRLRRQMGRQQHGSQVEPQQPMAMLQQVQEELETLIVEGSSGGGVVKVVVTGRQILQSMEISPEAAEDVELLQDLVIAAVNDGLQKSQELANEKLSALTGGLDIPGFG
jgi:DNA-binding YbaB/EbfC family protein